MVDMMTFHVQGPHPLDQQTHPSGISGEMSTVSWSRYERLPPQDTGEEVPRDRLLFLHRVAQRSLAETLDATSVDSLVVTRTFISTSDHPHPGMMQLQCSSNNTSTVYQPL